jgi:hypothetical protein
LQAMSKRSASIPVITMVEHAGLYLLAVSDENIDSRYLKLLEEMMPAHPLSLKATDFSILAQAVSCDETTLALACAINERIKKNKALLHFYFELDAENKNIPGILGLDNYAVFLKNKTFASVDLINELPLFNTPGLKDAGFVVTGNATSVQTVRLALKQHAVSGSIITQAYWATGKTGL